MRGGNVVAVFALSWAIAGCVTPAHNYQPTRRDISEPPVGVISTARVGEPMLTQGLAIESDGLRLRAPIAFGSIGTAYTLTAGEYVKSGQSAKGRFYRPGGGPGAGNVVAAALADPYQSIQVRPDGQICIVTIFNLSVCEKDASFEEARVTIFTDNSFQQTLIYSGRIGNEINVGYREFSGNLARPAFNNEVRYDLGASMTIGYKGAEIEVVEATNQLIRYRVIRNFNTPETAP